MSGENFKMIDILLVEDNEGDAFLAKKAFQKAKIANSIQVADDGDMAMDILRKNGEYSDAPTPDIVLMDINLPRKSGTEVLAEMKQDEALRRIPVVILTSSQADQDVLKSYDLQASGYIVKPIDLPKFQQIVQAIENFWFSVVVLPTE